MDFEVLYIYDCVTKFCMQQVEAIQNHENANVCNIGKGEARHVKYKRLKRCGGEAYNHSSDLAAVVTRAE
jgi:hypothetical protein